MKQLIDQINVKPWIIYSKEIKNEKLHFYYLYKHLQNMTQQRLMQNEHKNCLLDYFSQIKKKIREKTEKAECLLHHHMKRK